MRSFNVVIPAKAGIQSPGTRGQVWMPAFAGMTLTFLSHPPILNDSRDWVSAAIGEQGISPFAHPPIYIGGTTSFASTMTRRAVRMPSALRSVGIKTDAPAV